MTDISLRNLNEDDISKIEKWLNKDYIKKWYNEPEDWLTEINGRNEEYSWIQHMIVEVNGVAIGFCQYYDCYDANDVEDWYDVKIPNHTFSIDYLIGEEIYLNKGYGKSIVKALTKLIFEKIKSKRIIVQPDSDNIRSNSVLLANGYMFDSDKKYFIKDL